MEYVELVPVTYKDLGVGSVSIIVDMASLGVPRSEVLI
jgi:hypothetical protein